MMSGIMYAPAFRCLNTAACWRRSPKLDDDVEYALTDDAGGVPRGLAVSAGVPAGAHMPLVWVGERMMTDSIDIVDVLYRGHSSTTCT